MSISKFKLLFFLIVMCISCSIKIATDDKDITNRSGNAQWGIAGHWFELARMPNAEQLDCVADDQISLLPNEDNQLSRIFACRNSHNQLQATLSEAQSDSHVVSYQRAVAQRPGVQIDRVLHQPNAAWLSYRIYYLSGDGQIMILGSEDKQNGWIMARSAKLGVQQYQALIVQAKAIGFDVSKMNRTLQNPENLPFSIKSSDQSRAKPNQSSLRLMV